MKEKIHEDKIDTYLSGKMSEEEEKQFKADITDNHEMQEAFMDHVFVDTSVRDMVNEIREEVSPLPEPRLTWWEKMWLMVAGWPGGKKGLLVLAAGLLIALAAFIIDKIIDRVEQNPAPPIALATYIVPPYDPMVAGEDDKKVEEAMKFLGEAASIYKSEGDIQAYQPLLARCSEFCIVVQYYIAHSALKKEQYNKALEQFDQCLENDGVLSEQHSFYNQSWKNKLRFNRILSMIGSGKSKKAILSELNALLTGDTLDKKTKGSAEKLRKHYR